MSQYWLKEDYQGQNDSSLSKTGYICIINVRFI